MMRVSDSSSIKLLITMGIVMNLKATSSLNQDFTPSISALSYQRISQPLLIIRISSSMRNAVSKSGTRST
jgi:hypothetical protein